MEIRRLAAVLAVVAVASCSRSGPTFPPTSSLTEQCSTVPAGASRVVVTAADGYHLGAALLGPTISEVGVVIAYGQG